MVSKIFRRTFKYISCLKYNCLSTNGNIYGSPKKLQPVLFEGKGKIEFGNLVTLGYYPSPFYYNGYIHLEARRETAIIKFGSRIFANNNLTIICEGSTIEIGDDVLIGTNVEIIDSDFHEVHPDRRNSGNHKCKPVKIERNVFIGSNVKIQKGVTVGENSIIANGSIVTSSMPNNAVIAGNPAIVVRTLKYERS